MATTHQAPSGSGVATPDPDGPLSPTGSRRGTVSKRPTRLSGQRRPDAAVHRHRARPRYGGALSQPDRADPAGRGRLHRRQRRLAYVLGHDHHAGRVGRAQTHGRSVRCWSRSSTSSWVRSSPGCSSATGSPAWRSSTSSSTCRSRCRRSWPDSYCSRSTERRARCTSTWPTPASRCSSRCCS